MSTLISSIRASVVSLFLFTVLCGGIYPLVVTLGSSAIFPSQSSGSLLLDKNGVVTGSGLIGQNFTQPIYLWGRLSATAPTPYNAAASSGSNLGANNPALMDAVYARISALNTAGSTDMPIPVDLVTASASGLDPDISPAAALYQVSRIAKARNISEDEVKAAIAFATRGRTFGILGEPRVNVLEANLKLDGRLD
jgi:potassium-transporting ATPase KdpC subunit